MACQREEGTLKEVLFWGRVKVTVLEVLTEKRKWVGCQWYHVLEAVYQVRAISESTIMMMGRFFPHVLWLSVL